MTAAAAPSLPAPPRPVPLQVVAGRRWALALLGALLIVGGTTWLISRGGGELATLDAEDSPLRAPLGLLVLPGLALLGLWWRGVLRLRTLLTEGRAAAAEIRDHRQLPGLPGQDRITFVFRDAEGQEHQGRQVVPRDSAESQRARRGGDGLAVLYETARPGRLHWLIAAGKLGTG